MKIQTTRFGEIEVDDKFVFDFTTTQTISKSGILFYNTLFDENAACHLALGMGFDNCIRDYDRYTKEERMALGVNDSLIHVDFMIGSDDLSITGVTEAGTEFPIFCDGTWAF